MKSSNAEPEPLFSNNIYLSRYRCAEEGVCAPWCEDANTCIIKNNSDTALVKDAGKKINKWICKSN